MFDCRRQSVLLAIVTVRTQFRPSSAACVAMTVAKNTHLWRIRLNRKEYSVTQAAISRPMPAVAAAIEALAAQKLRSVNGQIEWLLREGLEDS